MSDDLDKLIAEPHEETVGKLAAFGRGALQGATLGFSDELAGVARAASTSPADWLYDKLHPGEGKSASFQERYSQGRDEARALNVAAEKSHPKLYLAGNVTGGIAPATLATLATGGAASSALPIALGEGGLSGLGASDATSAGGLARDTIAGAGVGLAGYGAGALFGKTFSGMAAKAGQKASAASARAAEMAAEDVNAPIRKAAGELGAETQKGSRYIENLMRLEESMTPEQRSAYAQLQQAGIVPSLQQSVAQGTLEALPGQSGRIAAKQGALNALQTAAPQALEQALAERSKSQFGKDAMSFAKSYAEPLVAAYLADKAGDAMGMTPEHSMALAGAAGLVFGRTRAGKALMTRVNRPGNQLALWNLVQGAANGATSTGAMPTLLRRGLMAAAVTPVAASANTINAKADAMVAALRARGVPVVGIKTPMGSNATSDDLDKLLNEAP